MTDVAGAVGRNCRFVLFGDFLYLVHLVDKDTAVACLDFKRLSRDLFDDFALDYTAVFQIDCLRGCED